MKNITELDNILSLDNCRKLLIVEGSEQFIDQILANYCDFYINETNFKTYSKSNAHLGNEFKVVGYNGCNRINPEMLYSLAGLIQFGGTLILGVKDFSNLANQDVFADSDKDRFRADKKTVLHNNFLSRMRRIIADSSIYAVYSEEKGLYINKIDENQSSLHDSNDSENNEIPLTVRFWLKSADKVLFITGDRGAGKSTLLGKIANCLQGNVLVSAPGKSSLVNFDRAVISGNAEFVSIDQLIERENYEGLILIDEIASIPVHQLKQIISKYPKVILSGTIDGYEGTANGIKLRLLPELEEENIGYKTVELKQGYRNSRNDKLGILWNKLFNPVIEVPQNNADYSKLAIKTVTCEELLDNEELLLAIFSILSKNHYQSQPSDLRQILDVPSNIIVYMESEGTVVGVLWGVQESIPSKLVSGVFLGTRRPKGNLIPQTLAAHAGFKNAGFYRFFRIVRIAVVEKYRRSNLGTMLVSYIYDHFCRTFDYLGVSFGVTLPLVQFWKNNGFTCVKLGMKPDHVTGLYSVVMLKPGGKLLDSVQYDWYKSFIDNLVLQASWQYKNLDPRIIAEMISKPHDEQFLNNQYWRDLESIACGHRTPEQALGSVVKWIVAEPLWNSIPLEQRGRLAGYFIMHSDMLPNADLDCLRQMMAKTFEKKTCKKPSDS